MGVLIESHRVERDSFTCPPASEATFRLLDMLSNPDHTGKAKGFEAGTVWIKAKGLERLGSPCCWGTPNRAG
jgi:hypothetical protein